MSMISSSHRSCWTVRVTLPLLRMVVAQRWFFRVVFACCIATSCSRKHCHNIHFEEDDRAAENVSSWSSWRGLSTVIVSSSKYHKGHVQKMLPGQHCHHKRLLDTS